MVEAEDHIEEQNDEIEALQSIFMEEFELISESPYTFTLLLKPDCSADPDSVSIAFKLKIEFPNEYPDVLPIYEIFVEEPLNKVDLAHLEQLTEDSIQDLVGSQMIFSLTEVLKEYLNDRLSEVQEVNKRQETKNKLGEEGEEEEKTFVGADGNFESVTTDIYWEWRETFDRQIEELKAKTINPGEKRLSGKQWFELKKEEGTKEIEVTEEEVPQGEDEVFYYDQGLYDDIDLPDEID